MLLRGRAGRQGTGKLRGKTREGSTKRGSGVQGIRGSGDQGIRLHLTANDEWPRMHDDTSIMAVVAGKHHRGSTKARYLTSCSPIITHTDIQKLELRHFRTILLIKSFLTFSSPHHLFLHLTMGHQPIIRGSFTPDYPLVTRYEPEKVINGWHPCATIRHGASPAINLVPHVKIDLCVS